MTTQNNVFIITSTINTNWGLISSNDRYLQTLDTISSIKQKDNTATIILIDNSTQPLGDEQYDLLVKQVTYFLDIGNRKPCIEFNKNGAKGAGEAYMLLVALDLVKQLNLTPKRLFKISARYKLSNEFNINFYDTVTNKYVFKTRNTNEYGLVSLHARLWSVCGSLISNMKELVSQSLYKHIAEATTIEEAMFKIIDKDLLVEVEQIHCEGIIAPWNQLIND
jgi:hypothetical protein